MVGIKLYFTTEAESESKIEIQQKNETTQSFERKPLSSTAMSKKEVRSGQCHSDHDLIF